MYKSLRALYQVIFKNLLVQLFNTITIIQYRYNLQQRCQRKKYIEDGCDGLYFLDSCSLQSSLINHI